MEIKDFEILETKIRTLIDELNKQKEKNIQLLKKVDGLNQQHKESINTESLVKNKIEGLIKIIDSIENE